jgi:hypothetical protein
MARRLSVATSVRRAEASSVTFKTAIPRRHQSLDQACHVSRHRAFLSARPRSVLIDLQYDLGLASTRRAICLCRKPRRCPVRYPRRHGEDELERLVDRRLGRASVMLHQDGSCPSGWPAGVGPVNASSTDTLSFWT